MGSFEALPSRSWAIVGNVAASHLPPQHLGAIEGAGLVLDRIGKLRDVIGLDLDGDFVEALAQLLDDRLLGCAVLP